MTSFIPRRVVNRGIAGLLGTLLILWTTVATAADTDVIARVGTTDVTVADMRAYLETLDPRERAALRRQPAQLNQAVRQILALQVVLKEALAKKWDQTPAVVTQIARMRDKVVAESYLQSVSKPADGYPSDAEIQTAYDANKTAFLAPRQFQLAHIFVAVAKDADKAAQDAARKRAEDIVKKLRRGTDFATLAQTESDDKETAKKAGEIGWIYETQILPEIRTPISGLAKNDYSDPLKLDDGWHIFKVMDTKAAYTRPLAEVRDQIAQELRAERSQANRRAYLAKLMQDNPPEVNELALGSVLSDGDK
jgi:peptidylprolyl isomerase